MHSIISYWRNVLRIATTLSVQQAERLAKTLPRLRIGLLLVVASGYVSYALCWSQGRSTRFETLINALTNAFLNSLQNDQVAGVGRFECRA